MCFFRKKEKNLKFDDGISRAEIVILDIDEHYMYTLYSLKFKKEFKMSMDFYYVEKPSVGDVLEVPHSMLCMQEGYPMFSNNFLYLGKPNAKMAIPKDFDIRQDYAFLTYSKKKKRIKLQRYYG